MGPRLKTNLQVLAIVLVLFVLPLVVLLAAGK